MGDVIFAFGVFVTLCCYVALAYFLWNRRRQNQKTVSRPHHVIGEVTSIDMDENGVTLTGKLNEHGMALRDAGALGGHLSAGFTNVSGSVNVDGVRVIKDAKIHSVSIDAEPGPYGGEIKTVSHIPIHREAVEGDILDYVGTQPEERDA